MIKGYLLSSDQGGVSERLLIGFGEGAAEFRAAVEGREVTPNGLRLLGRGETAAASGKTPGLLARAATLAAAGKPVALIVGGASKVMGESQGWDTLEGQAKRTACNVAWEMDIARGMKVKFKEQGWM